MDVVKERHIEGRCNRRRGKGQGEMEADDLLWQLLKEQLKNIHIYHYVVDINLDKVNSMPHSLINAQNIIRSIQFHLLCDVQGCMILTILPQNWVALRLIL